MNNNNFANIVDDFSYLDEWEDRYSYIIDIGKKIPLMPDSLKTDANKIDGCISQVWLHCTPAGCPDNGCVLNFQADSDAAIVKGLAGILLKLYDNQPPDVILKTDALHLFQEIGLDKHISPNRRNGFAALVQKIKSYAQIYSKKN
jgi:cysteine desulfuration protein SufE